MESDSQTTPHTLESKVAGLPTRPGVYLHKNAEGQIIYVGKAKSLRNRVRSYFQEGRPTDAKTKALMRHIHDFEVIVTDTEVEALILENTLIKEHRPKYNVLLKDDKSYPYIRITKEEYPRVLKTRRVVRDGSRYFGPYTDGTYLFQLMKTLRAIFPLRSCELALTEKSIAAGRWKVCLDYHIKKCDGPCEGHITRDRYNEYIRQAQQVLSGRTKDLERQLEERMMELAEELRFEDAAVIRLRIENLRVYTEKQKVLASDDADRDVFALARAEGMACTVVFTIRDGKLIGKRHFFVMNSRDQSDEEIVQTMLERWYLEAENFPSEILVPFEMEGTEAVLEFVRQQRGSAVELIVPKIGDKKKLVTMAEMNAEVLLRDLQMQQAQKDQSMPRAILSLQQDLRMEKMPRRIECYDNSHIQGTDYVSSMVVFVDGKPKKSEYRNFKLRTVEGNDDFEAMKEVITRRFERALEEGAVLPDLVIIDGGKGQLSHAMEILSSLGLAKSFTVVGLAKRLEEVFVPGMSTPLYLSKSSSSLRLMQQARDEAHRFAVSYHRKLRSKRTIQTELTQIEGVGETSATKLLSEIGSVERVRNASIGALSAVVGQAIAGRVYTHYHSPELP